MQGFKIQLVVFLQQLFLLLYLIQWPLYLPWWGYGIIVLLCLPAFWAVYLQRSQLKISPTPKENAELYTHGPYRYIRHPMYISLLLALLVPLLYQPNVMRISNYGILLVIMLVKIHVEEHLLSEKYSDYQEYQYRTKRLVPFIY